LPLLTICNGDLAGWAYSRRQKWEAPMRYRVLGPVEVECDGLALAVGGPQQRRLLGVLLVHFGQVVSADRVVEALWSDDSRPEGASRSIPTYVSRLRAVLGNSTVVAAGAGYRLDAADGERDLDEFEALVTEADRSLPDRAIDCYDRALDMWRGPAYGEFAGEWWALAESRRLGEMRVVAREQRAAALITIGHQHRALPDLEGLMVEHPLRERPVSLLMQALHATGRQAEALRAFRRFRQHLADETGLEPTAELVRLERSITGDVESPTDNGSGRPLRGYTLHEAVGEGAFGRVYSATQPGTNRRVAIKVIRPDLADSSDFIRRFEAEAQLVARLEHPHIVPLYDYWREPGGAFLVFRFLNGGTAREAVITGGAWSLVRVSRLVEEIGGALIAAHAVGVAHNDVKSSNVLLDGDGGTYLTDFGIAVTGDDPAAATDAEHHDLRSFGWMVWELLTGSPPAMSATRSSLARGSTPSLIGRMTGVPEGLNAVLAKATTPTGGHASVADFVLAWRAAMGHPVLTPVPSDERLAADSARRLAARQLVQATAAGVNPYKGLRPFDQADEAVFFGRGEAVAALAEMVANRPFVTVVGASGSGKSSVVRAGLIPRLRTDGCTVATMTPGDAPVEAICQALSEVSAQRQPSGDPVIVAYELAQHTERLLVVVIDQLEECWTRSTVDGRDEFLGVIAQLTSGDPANVRVVATVRADMFDRPLQHPLLGHRLGDGAFVLSPLSPAQLGDAVVLPAARAGVIFDEGVVADLVAEAAAQPGTLPMLQFTLTELYDRRVDASIGRDALTALGGMSGTIGRRAEAVYESLDMTAQADARELFGRLVIPGDGTPDVRRRARLGELSPGARAVASAFVDARLLVTDREQATREPTVEVAHEALLSQWPRLGRWIDDDHRWLTQLQHLEHAARSWDAGGRGAGELYRGARLESSIEALDVDARTVSAMERQFIEAGRTARDAEIHAARRTARRLRRLLIGVAAALVIAVVAGAFAVVQRHYATTEADNALAAAGAATAAGRQAKIEALVGRVVSMRTTQRDTAALLAVEAFRLADTPRTRSALLSTFTGDAGFLDTHRLDQDVTFRGLVMPDGASAFVTDPDGRVRPYDLDTGTRGEPFPALGATKDPSSALSASPDGRFLTQVAASRAGGGTITSTIGIFDLASRTLVTKPIEVDGPLAPYAVFGDGDRTLLVARAPEGAVLRYDTASGAELGELTPLASTPVDPYGPAPAAAGLEVAGDRLIVGSRDGLVRVVDPGSLEVLSTIAIPANTSTSLLAVGDGTTIVGSGPDGVLRIDVTSGSILWEQLDPAGSCLNMTVVAQRDAVFCGDSFGRLQERDLATGELRRTFDAQNGSSGSLWAARNGSELVSFGSDEPLIARWRLDGSGPITRLMADGWGVNSYSPNGKLLLVEAIDLPDVAQSTNTVIDAATGAVVASFAGLISTGWSDDDTLVGAVLHGDGDHMQGARYELSTGTLIADGAIFDRPDMGIVDIGVPRAQLGFNTSASTAEVWTIDAKQRVEPTIKIDASLMSLAATRNGDRIAVGTDGGIVIYDGYSGVERGRIRGSSLRGASITPADQLFVSSLGGELTMYDLETLQPIRPFGGSRGFVHSVSGSADGRVVAAQGSDRQVILYDVGTGVRLGDAIPIGDDESNYTALSLDGTQLAVGGGPQASVKVWDLDPQDWVDAACRMAGRNLTKDEWDTSIGDLAPYHTTCPGLPVPTAAVSTTG
jgi:DNA-binding SARP family transcriptional activator/WD40 repeat protein